MKQLQSLVLFLVLSTITYGQFPVQPSPTGSVNTLQRNAGAYEVGRGIVITNFIDTTAANNVSFMKGTPYIEIRTSDDKIWRRNSIATKWIQLGGSGTGIDSTAHYTITQQSDSLYALFEKRNGGKDTLTFVGIPSGSGGSGWGLTGNASTSSVTNFIGTTDNVGLRFRVNNVRAGIIDSASANTSLGFGTLRSVSGASNNAFGYNALSSVTTGTQNNAFGGTSQTSNLTGSWNTSVGERSLVTNTAGQENVAVGFRSLNLNTASYNTAIGSNSMQLNTTGSINTAYGAYSMRQNSTGTANVALGYSALRQNTAGSYNVAIGTGAGFFVTGSKNIIIGDSAALSQTAISNKLWIDNSNTSTPLLGGDFSVDRVDINGTLKVTGGSPAIGKVFTSIDANGTGSWETPAVGSGSIDYVTQGYGIKVDSSSRVYTVRVDTTVIGSKTYIDAKNALKLNIADTASMLSPYLRTAVASSTYQPIGSYLTNNQTITLSGVVTGTGSTSINTTINGADAGFIAAVGAIIEDSSKTIRVRTGLEMIGDSILQGKIVSAVDTGMLTPQLKAKYDQEVWIISISDQVTPLTTGTAKFTFRVPYGATVTGVRASLQTASSSGIPTFDINKNGTTILSTKLTIDASEKTSSTAAVSPVISVAGLDDDSEITIDIDVAGTGAIGAIIYIYHTKDDA